MHRFLIYLTATAGLASASGSAICSSNPYKLFQPFSTYGPAQSFCSSRFPVAPVTTTTTVAAYATSTVTTIQTALTTQVIQSTLVSTEVDSVTVDVTTDATSDTFSTSTETDFVTVTVTVTGPVQAKAKRTDAPTVPTSLLAKWPLRIAAPTGVVKRELEARTQKTTSTSSKTTSTSSKTTMKTTTSTTSKTTTSTTSKTTTSCTSNAAWSGLAAQASAILSTGCSCIETPKTVTATQTSTTTGTVTNTVTVTNLATSTSFGSSTATSLITVTSTVTLTDVISIVLATTTTATATATDTACVAGPTMITGEPCQYNVLCNTEGTYTTDQVVPDGATNIHDCLIDCNRDDACGGVNFNHVTGTCVRVRLPAADGNAAGAAAYTAVANPVNDFAYYTGGCVFYGY
ncbi:hypothetical protein LTR95_008899 [Oleoguttula sp. CCFEE 5521]